MLNLKSRYGLTEPEMDKLCAYWYRMGKRGERELFGTFDDFLKWAADNGYRDGLQMVPVLDTEPIGPNNARWVTKEERYQGMPSGKKPQRHPCCGCTRERYCTEICPARAKWWDVGMEKLRKRFGV